MSLRGATHLAVVPEGASLTELAAAANRCRACPIGENATQAVFGEGPARAEVMLVGEQPGDQEDRVGEPFVGPAGKLLDRALEAAGIDRGRAYVTNAVKHFKWEPRGKRRIHSKPTGPEIRACRPFLEAELANVEPRALVLMGATAAQSLLGSAFKVTASRGRLIPSTWAAIVVATVHPSSILRARSDEEREAGFCGLVHDLEVVARALA
jgi:uracil-DNA glycosylase family protein